jgi:hypothetical protein
MARTQITRYTDDVDGTEIKDGKGGPVSFAFDGTEYVIDLTDKNKSALAKALDPYIGVATKVSKRGRKAAASKDNPADVRAWARDNGFDVPDRGRIPANVRAAYEGR